MKNKIATWRFIGDSLQREIAVMMLYVVESSGSSPGRKGFIMAVNSRGEMEGSLGGGIMEHKFVEKAKAILRGEQTEALVQKQIHNKTAAKNQSGMICSGEQTILLYTVQAVDAVPINQILSCLINNKSGLLTLSPEGLSCTNVFDKTETGFTNHSISDWVYTEVIGNSNKLYIIGGGHCSLALSKLMQDMDFYTCLFDDRKDLHTMQKNTYANEKVLLNDYVELQNYVEDAADTYAVIMTFGYRTDDVALRTLMHKNFKYLGVLGSAKKIEKMFTDYRNEGIAESVLSKIYAPIGIPIKSQTPEEIAVSIAAEIIKVKNVEL